ncbi:hypothetical protein [Spiroplasma clarkii]|uniref:Uncharacterized protein n=1 Tax=Spiroplasma clarkii TaxID=2139 RepID=A0A2K8KL55_9MOLU|nr:hypothetical protein [Spiroplasma clarkii]ATX71031.1 hypothetical protein SCLAR_v1c07140 [Spiroplasma clarkii]
MQVRKIILKNFIKPGVQTYIFDKYQKLVAGKFYDIKQLQVIKNLLAGKWDEESLSFNKYYPNFRKKIPNMDLQIDALIGFTDEELLDFNKLILPICGKIQKSNNWFYTIKCVYPFLFPIVKLTPADHKLDQSFIIGSHYDKFNKPNASKSELLTVVALNAINLIREKYYEYINYEVKAEELAEHKHYLEILHSIFTNQDDFIEKVKQVFNNIDDGDVIRFGDEKEFFLRSKPMVDFINKYELFKTNAYIAENFKSLLAETLFIDVEWVFATKTASNAIEMRKVIWENYGYRCIPTKDIMKLMKFNFQTDRVISKAIKQIEFKDSKSNPILWTNRHRNINFFAKDYTNPGLPKVDLKVDQNLYNVNRRSASIALKKMRKDSNK